MTDENPIDDFAPSPTGLVKIYTAADLGEAQTVALFLESYDIPAMVPEDPFLTMPRVYVPAELEEKAKKALEEMEQISQRGEERNAASEDLDEGDIPWKSWPRCPACSAFRMVECPTCRETGAEFPLADEPSDSEKREPGEKQPGEPAKLPLLMCPRCSDVFRPVFLNRCQQCGQHFADGRPPLESGSVITCFGLIMLTIVGLVITRVLFLFF